MDALQGYLDRIHTYLPDVQLVSSRLNTDGLQHEVVILNEEIVVRFARNEEAREDQRHEAAVLDLVRRHVDLPVPQVEQLHDGVMISRFIGGLPLAHDVLLRLPHAGQDRIAGQLALFISQLHGISADEARLRGILRSGSLRTPEDWERMYRAVEQQLFPHLWEHARAWVRRLFAPVLEGTLPMTFEPVLIHGDLAGYHLLHDPNRQVLSGVIDFGTAGLGDPAVDLACLLQVLGEGFVQRMVRHQPSLAASLGRARFRAAALELEWALHGLETNDPGWWTAHIGNARDLMPPGQGV